MPAVTSHLGRRNAAAKPRQMRHTRHLLGTLSLGISAALIGLGLSAVAPVAQAQSQWPSDACTQATTILQNAYPDARPDPDKTGPKRYVLGEQWLMLPGNSSGDAPSMVCKVWPAHDTLLLVAVPRMSAKASLDHDRVGDLDILVLDRASLKVQQRLSLADAMSDDAIRIEGLAFDTARYVIAPGIQAFGLRTMRNSGSRANPFNEVSLSLFAMRDGGSGPLAPVLEKLSVSRSNGEWDTNCTGEFHERNLVLAMRNEQHQGRYDIRVSQEYVSSKAELTGPDKECKETASETKKTQQTLAYDGKRYVVPASLKSH
ncbi:hypothetical protein FXN63_11870 [Pigmentiphaga aceris]|uniref:Uncharacterized protein n=1 Tax=Pigmentiphaga aceris TaxID=1940612 RepID=A0A5C0B0S7_9BURK|nr:hypothetical protein [Pigmentiphaga aceris]QEI06451.1 hypothetical protein FXN63_11870 [Pigmentiphaga aceris]